MSLTGSLPEQTECLLLINKHQPIASKSDSCSLALWLQFNPHTDFGKTPEHDTGTVCRFSENLWISNYIS